MRKRLRGFVLALSMVAALLLGSANVYAEELVLQQDSQNAATYPTVKVSGTYCQSNARAMFNRVNEFRTTPNQWQWNENNTTKKTFNTNSRNTLTALTYDYNLEKVAMIRAVELALKNSHYRPNGGNYTTLGWEGNHVRAENIATGFRSASQVETAWEEENANYSGQGHRRNILNPEMKTIGIGCFYCNETLYWVQEFGDVNGNPIATEANDSAVVENVEYSEGVININQAMTTVFFHYMTPNNAIEGEHYSYGEPLDELYSPSRKKYTFDGWYTAETGGERVTGGMVPGVIGDYHLYAHWSEGSSSTPTPAPSSNTTPSTNTTPTTNTTPNATPSSDNTASTPATNEGGTNGFVRRMYQVVLNREPDDTGFYDWVSRLNSGEAQAVEIVFGFVNSEEYRSRGRSNGEIVNDCYHAMLGRDADEAGYNDWVSKLDTGMSVNAILAGFVGSQEFGNLCASYGIQPGSYSSGENRDQNIGVTSYVARLYTQALGRDYDPDGLNDWCGKILANTDRNNIIQVAANGFFHSQEFENKGLSNEEYVKVLYHTFLGRDWDDAGLADWVGQLDRGEKTRDEILPGFANSQEFTDIMAQYGL